MDAETLLSCWEHGRHRHALDRALLLYAIAAPAEDPESLADRTLGERNAALLRLRQSVFGDRLDSCVECPACSEALEFSLSAATLLARAATRPTRATDIEVSGQRVRLPTTRDLAAVARQETATPAAHELLLRLCASKPMVATPEEIARALDEADPCMDLSVELTCPSCSHGWAAAFDVPAFVWEEIEVRARGLLDEVHVLAHAYHWDEQHILALSETRRHAYLERVLS
jgi:hypothetical protein